MGYCVCVIARILRPLVLGILMGIAFMGSRTRWPHVMLFRLTFIVDVSTRDLVIPQLRIKNNIWSSSELNFHLTLISI